METTLDIIVDLTEVFYHPFAKKLNAECTHHVIRNFLKTYPYSLNDYSVWEVLEYFLEIDKMSEQDLLDIECEMEEFFTYLFNHVTHMVQRSDEHFKYRGFIDQTSVVFRIVHDENQRSIDSGS